MVTLANPVARQLILAEHIANTTGFLLGTAGYGQLGRFNDINDSAAFSVIIGNQDTTNGFALLITYGTTALPTTLATFSKGGISFELATTTKQLAAQANPPTGYTNIGARSSDGRPVYRASGGSETLLGLTTDSVLLSTFTTAGDIVQATGSGAVARLGIGTARQNLQVNAGATALTYAASLQSLMTAQGDIPYASSANTPTVLAKGTAGQVLTMNAGATAPQWSTNTATRNQVDHVIGTTSGPTQATGTYAVLAEMTRTLTTTGGDLLVWCVVSLSNSTTSSTTTLGIRLDGATAVFEVLYGEPTATLVQTVTLVGRFPLSGVGGSHTVDIVWKVDSGTATAHTTRRTLLVMES